MEPNPQQTPKRKFPITPFLALVFGLVVTWGVLGNFWPIGDSCAFIADASLGPPYTKRTECYTKKAVAINNPRLCLRIGGSVSGPYKNSLVESCVQGVANEHNNLSACDMLKGFSHTGFATQCRTDLHDYNLIYKNQGNTNISAQERQAHLQAGYTQLMQERADAKFKGSPFSWQITFQLVDENAQYINCQSKGIMTATLKSRMAWDALDEKGKKKIVTDLMIYVYSNFGSKQVVDVYADGKLLARGDNVACGSKALVDEVQLF